MAKEAIVLCWLCRVATIINGVRTAEAVADMHALKNHRRTRWENFMECETVESFVADRRDFTMQDQIDAAHREPSPGGAAKLLRAIQSD